MFLTRTCVHRAHILQLRPLLRAPQSLKTTHSPLQILTTHHRSLTHSSNARPKPPQWPQQPPKKPKTYALPPTINIFTTPLLPFTTLYFTRLLSLLLLGAGTVFSPPYILFSPTIPSTLIPLIALASAIPAALSGYMVGGYVSHVNLHLPAEARKSPEALRRWVERGVVPGRTGLEVRCLWFRPWLHRSEIEVGELRRLPGAGWREGWVRLANLEVVPLEGEEELGGVMRRLRRRIFVMQRPGVSGSGKGKGRVVGGVWEAVWESIPFVGMEVEGERKLVRQEKTHARTESLQTERKAAPPPPPKPRP